MKTVHEVSALAGVSIRTLQYYDSIGLLKPSKRTESGYRLYDREDLARLQQILLFRELEFPLKEIRRIIESSDFDRTRALAQQVGLLELKRDRLSHLIDLARDLMKGADVVSFSAFDSSEIDAYAERAKASWGDTPEWGEFERRNAGRSPEEGKRLGDELLDLFVPFGRMAAEGADPASAAARQQAQAIQAFISEHFYACSNEVFAQLGRAYGSGGDFTRNIDAAAGPGAGEFAAQAIASYVR